MKLTTLLIIVSMLQVSAASFAQKITMSEKNVPLSKIFKQIHRQTGFDVIFTTEALKGTKSVSIDVKNTELSEVLDQIFADQPLEFSLDANTVIVSRKEPSFLDRLADRFSNIDVRGRVVDSAGSTLAGATIKIKGTERVIRSNEKGDFFFANVDENAVLVISYLGYQEKEIKAVKELGTITLALATGKLEEVNVVSTGFQTIPKERATGSFVSVDSTLLNRKVGANILDRLDGVTSGLLFNKNKIGNTPIISVRGRSTISSNTDPLIVLDNFPYDGDLSNINPQDVKSITVLKDGAAASIWGSRAGNGVIVITTYKGAFNQKPVVSFNTNLSIGDKPDLFHKDQLTNQQFIGVEQFLFDKGAYNSIIDNGYGSLSPAVQIMLLNRTGKISGDRKVAMLDSIVGHDNRNDLDKYYYRKSISQQYQLNVNGGGKDSKYYVSLGYDRNLANQVINNNNRLTLNANNTVSLFNKKIELYTGIMFVSNNALSNSANGNYAPKYPYENIGDKNGNPLAITDGNLRLSYVDTAGKGKLLDWHYRPLNELKNSSSSRTSKITDYRVNIGLLYNILSFLKFDVKYTYDKGINEAISNNGLNSYYTRNLINTYTQINNSTGIISYPIPMGDIQGNTSNVYYSHYGRATFSFQKTFYNKHSINAIAGYEIKDYNNSSGELILYGYNKETATNSNSAINPILLYPAYFNSNTSRIQLGINNSGATDRYRSAFFNGSYVYDNRYILSGSLRKDESNLFGVKANQKGIPLWSAGLAWDISKEKFFDWKAISNLKLKATYGYNGNVNKSISAYLTASTLNGSNSWQQQSATIVNPPNPSLTWEQVKNIDLGIEFQTNNNWLSGSIDYWIKDGLDLIGSSPIAAQTGIVVYTGNSANMHGTGVDVMLTSHNIRSENFKWSSTALINYNTDKITSYKLKTPANLNIVSGNYLQPLQGYSYYSVFSYKWMGLDNQGDPQSILNGQISKDYAAIRNSSNSAELVYSGTLSPKYYGSLINTVNYKSFELSFNFIYKFGHVYRRNSFDNSSLVSTSGSQARFQQSDYNLRWQKPGDELITNVPSLLYPDDGSRQSIYTYSNILVEKADNIRLQDVRLNYTLPMKINSKIGVSNINVYVYLANLGIIWKASKYKIDPDYPNQIPIPKIYSLGLKADF